MAAVRRDGSDGEAAGEAMELLGNIVPDERFAMAGSDDLRLEQGQFCD
jgi:hypothetical protein